MTRLLIFCASLLVLPLAALLFAQWPLRELVQAYSREANDLAQILFALYMAVGVTAATEDGAHLAAGHTPDVQHTALGGWRAWAVAACIVPWAVFLLWSSAEAVWQSLRQLERFSETFNPGYFLIKVALWLMAALALVHCIARTLRRRGN